MSAAKTPEQVVIDDALDDGEIGPEVHAAATAMMADDAGLMKAVPGFSLESFLTFLTWAQSQLKWLSDNAPMILNNAQTFLALLNQLFKQKA